MSARSCNNMLMRRLIEISSGRHEILRRFRQHPPLPATVIRSRVTTKHVTISPAKILKEVTNIDMPNFLDWGSKIRFRLWVCGIDFFRRNRPLACLFDIQYQTTMICGNASYRARPISNAATLLPAEKKYGGLFITPICVRACMPACVRAGQLGKADVRRHVWVFVTPRRMLGNVNLQVRSIIYNL